VPGFCDNNRKIIVAFTLSGFRVFLSSVSRKLLPLKEHLRGQSRPNFDLLQTWCQVISVNMG
jgi:hypothetical protein